MLTDILLGALSKFDSQMFRIVLSIIAPKIIQQCRAQSDLACIFSHSIIMHMVISCNARAQRLSGSYVLR